MSKETNPEYHVPVLLQEAVDALRVKIDGIYVDCTFGGGGHSREILQRMGNEGKLIAFDQDADARRNLPEDDRIIFVPHNFRHLQRFLKLHKVQWVDGILADLGVSSHQFNEGERGFSTRSDDANLDMRMDQRQELTAQTILSDYSEQRLHKLFEQYGEVTNAKTLAKTIVDARRTTPFKTIAGFKNAVHDVVKEMLQQVPEVLNEGGRIAVITFHSIEDRIVKIFFKEGGFDYSDEHDVYG